MTLPGMQRKNNLSMQKKTSSPHASIN